MAEQKAEEEELRLSHNPCTLYRNRSNHAIERVVVIGGGPAGMTAAIYAARSNLCPLVIAPAMGGQLMAKGAREPRIPPLQRPENRQKWSISIQLIEVSEYFRVMFEGFSGL